MGSSVVEVRQEVEVLCRPLAFGTAQLRNRIAMAPMTRNRSPGGMPAQEVVDYYARRAAGGAGLIITEGTCIGHPAANGYADVPAFYGEALKGWKRVVDAVHEHGALIVPQLWHVGQVRRPGTEPDPGVPGIGPHEIEESGQPVVRAMTPRDIAEVTAAYARAACDARQHGFDGVEIHGAHGYLIDQFLWAQSNRRTDEYGGSIENRARLAVEIVRAIRAAVPPDFPVIFRFSQWKMSDYAARIAENASELARILEPLSEAGVDIFHVSTRRFWEPAFDGNTESLAACTRRITGKPVIAVGSIGLAKQHETRRLRTRDNFGSETADLTCLLDSLSRDHFDIAAVGRGMLADAAWANKVLGGRACELNDLTDEALQSLV